MTTSGLLQGLYIVSQWVTRLAYSNFIWILFSLPIFYLTFNLLFASTADGVLINAITIAVLAPFFFFPATAALFGVVRKWQGGEYDLPTFLTFWKLYKENYWKSMAGGFIIVPLWIILVIDYIYFSNIFTPLYYVFLAVGVFMIVFTIHFFSNLVHFHLTFFQILKNSMLLSIGKPLHTIGIAITTTLILYLTIKVLTFLILIGTGSTIAFISYYIFRKSLAN